MKALTKGRVRRALQLGKLGASFALKQGKAMVSKEPAQAHRELAEVLVRELGQMKGLPMKIGQLLSYMDGLAPEEHQEMYQEILGQLRTMAEPIQEAACLEVLERELGAPPEEVFERFDPTPIAAASIGQVYRGTYGPHEVCIKVQYPGIAEATASDLKNIDAVMGLMRSLMPTINTEQMIEDFRVRLEEECDYTQEAAYQARFAEIYADDPDILIPGVIEELSTRRVLVTHFIEGQSMESFVEDATEQERERASRALFRFAFGTLLQHGLFHADPHPGNVLFRVGEGGKIGVLDFGCVQPIDGQARGDLLALFAGSIRGEELEPLVHQALGIGEIDEVTGKVVADLTGRFLEPIGTQQPYLFTREFAAQIAQAAVQAKMELATGFLTRKRRLVFEREGVMFIVRNLFGLASIWGTLRAKSDFRGLMMQLLDQAPA